MDSRPGRAPAATTGVGIPAGVGSVAVEPDIPPAVAKRIASAVQSSRPEGTRKTYAAAWRRFISWCEANGHVTLPAHPITVAVATFGTWIAAINCVWGAQDRFDQSSSTQGYPLLGRWAMKFRMGLVEVRA